MAETIAPEALPRLIGELEEIKTTALARLSAPSTAIPQTSSPDALLGIKQAAGTLGTSASYLYRHHADFAFTRRVGRKLLFSSEGIQRYLRVGKRLSR